MKSPIALLGAASVGLCCLAASAPASAQSAPARAVTIDENGNGSVTGGVSPITLANSIVADLGPGGLPHVLTYALPVGFTVVPGDVRLTDANFNDATLDVIRFNQVVGATALPGSIAFYSDNIDGFDALADTSGPPGSLYPNTVTIAELGPESGPNGATYTPTPNQPGYVPGFAVTYNFISDSAVPEPATWAMMLLGFGGIGFAMRGRRTRKAAQLA